MGGKKKKNQWNQGSFYRKSCKPLIDRQVLSLASFVAFFNLRQLISNSEEKPLTIIVGGLQYIGNAEILKRHYILEEKYWRNFFSYVLQRINATS